MVTKLLAACTAALFVAGVLAASAVEAPQASTSATMTAAAATASSPSTEGAANAGGHSEVPLATHERGSDQTDRVAASTAATGLTAETPPTTPAATADDGPLIGTTPSTIATHAGTADVEDHPSVANAAPPTTDPPLQGPFKAPTATAVRTGPCVAATPNGWNLDYEVTLAGGDNWRFPTGVPVTDNGATGTYTEAVRYPSEATPPAAADITIRWYRLIDAGTNLLRTIELPADLVTTVTCGG